MAAESGIGLASTAHDSDSPTHATIASLVPHRRPLRINAWPDGARWSVVAEDVCEDLTLSSGDTDDLTQVARAAHAWHTGADLPELHRAAPFLRPTGRYEVPDHDPLHLVESEWRALLAESRKPAEAGRRHRALVKAAYAEPRLRNLFPFTSHWALRFSTTTRPFMTLTGPALLAFDDHYTVSAAFTGTPALVETSTPEAAVAALLPHLPSPLPPIALGCKHG
ncbi:DUF6193 family natural product biosynthesis protein [Streptomyces sp. NPDC051561]|uniref:DUF6193 family natural product biosynthesis protein n=1 Tax=Streptomyces sp. NPDC051561 TaxID=3365658 RepID=UPI0037916874